MKALIENKVTYKITGERGDFFIAEDNKGKAKMFAKHLVEVVEIEEMPKAKTYKSIMVSSKTATKLANSHANRIATAEYNEYKF